MTVTFIIITIVYLFVIGLFVLGFDKLKAFRLEDISPKTTFTVIIPFRNEAENLQELLDSIYNLNYPKHLFEVILVNDQSEDKSLVVINKFLETILINNKNTKLNIKTIDNQRLTKSPKKDAIISAIKQAKHTWIITTDADCSVPKYWLDSYDNYIQNNTTKLIAGPVDYSINNGFLDAFQSLDFLSLIGATIGGFGIKKPFLCNGANLAYQKDYFISLNGFEGNTNIASGDDIFLMEKALKQDKSLVHYLKNTHAIVKTKPQTNLNALIWQRVRWASKTSRYNNNFAKLVGLLVLLMNASIVIGFALAALGLFPVKSLVYLFIIKILIDFLLLYKASLFFNKTSLLKHYVWSCFVYPFFSVYVAFISMFLTYKWKNRRFKK